MPVICLFIRLIVTRRGGPMEPFDALSLRGQGRRLRPLAANVLAHYDLAVTQIRLIANHLNTIFRVDTADGPSYVLRISHPTWRTPADQALEIAWLRALAAETDIGASA